MCYVRVLVSWALHLERWSGIGLKERLAHSNLGLSYLLFMVISDVWRETCDYESCAFGVGVDPRDLRIEC